jgi:hypothetical protein
MEFSVKLAKLPEAFKLPERLRERVSYDADRGRLSYRGFMTKCTYDELSALSDDPEYHRALEKLFVQTSEEISPHSTLHKVPAAIALATVGAAALAIAAFWGLTRREATAQPAAPDSTATASTVR